MCQVPQPRLGLGKERVSFISLCAKGCSPRAGHVEDLWERAGLPVSHCPASAGNGSPLRATASGGDVEKILWDIENAGQRNDLEIFLPRQFCFLKHQQLIALYSPQISYFFSEVRLST